LRPRVERSAAPLHPFRPRVSRSSAIALRPGGASV